MNACASRTSASAPAGDGEERVPAAEEQLDVVRIGARSDAASAVRVSVRIGSGEVEGRGRGGKIHRQRGESAGKNKIPPGTVRLAGDHAELLHQAEAVEDGAQGGDPPAGDGEEDDGGDGDGAAGGREAHEIVRVRA